MARSKVGLVVTIAAATLVACGSSTSSPQASVRNAAAKTLAQKTVALNITLNNPSVANKPSTGSGTYDFATNQGHLNPLVLYGVAGVPDGSSADVVLQLPVVYARLLGSAARALPIPTPWIKLDLRALANIPGLDLGTIAEAQSASPRQFLLFLRGAATPATKVGAEQVAGASTTHYHVSCDLTAAVKGLTGADATAINTAIASFPSPTVPADVWIDGAGLIRRMRFAVSVKNSGSKPPTAEQAEFDFTGFGVTVDTAAPPPNQTTDIAGLLKALAGG